MPGLPTTLRGTQRVRAPRRLGEVVAAELVASIVSSTYMPGDRLPTEPELEDTFGVSRTAVREAMKWIESRGLVTIRQGRGAIINSAEEWDLTEPVVLDAMLRNGPQSDIFEQLMTVRAWLEPEMARQAAQQISDSDLDLMQSLLDAMDTTGISPDEYIDIDIEFHDIIAKSANNLVARSIMRSIGAPLRITRRMMHENPSAAGDANAEHTTILAALKAHDGEAAALAMSEHLASGARRGEVVLSLAQ